MKRVFICIAIVLILASLFCPALAQNADKVYDVYDYDDLIAASEEINQEAAALPSGTQAPLSKIVIHNDITFGSSSSTYLLVPFLEGTRVIVEGAGAQKPVLTVDWAKHGDDSANIFYAHDADVTLRNLDFNMPGGTDRNGYCGVNGDLSTLTIENCIFRNLEYRPAAGYFYDPRSSISIIECTLVVRDCVFKDNKPAGFWFLPNACIAAMSSDVEVYRSTFEGNTSVETGSALYASDLFVTQLEPRLYVEGCTFTKNCFPGSPSVKSNATDAQIKDCTFTQNYAGTDDGELSDGAGAAAFSLCSVDIENCTFTNNETDLSGGALLFMIGTTATIKGSTISGNKSVTHGGAICIADHFSEDASLISTVSIEDTLIENNTAACFYSKDDHRGDNFAPGGGAIYVHPACEVTLGKGTVVKGNKALNLGGGGAIYASYDGVVTVNGAIIENNEGLLGGAIFLEGAGDFAGEQGSHEDGQAPKSYGTGAVMTLTDGRIAGNTARENGGAVYLGGSTYANKTEYAGAAMTMSGGVITDNLSKDAGGAIYLQADTQGRTAAKFTMTGGAIYHNVAGENGNESTGAKDAGAEIFSEGGNTSLSVISAVALSQYLHDEANAFVPDEDRTLWFTDWYDDYSDQDVDYGKSDSRKGTGAHTGRYMSSLVIDRMVYTPVSGDEAYRALILGCETSLTLTKTTESKKPLLYTFRITFPNLPSLSRGGRLYPVSVTSNVECDAFVTLPGGKLCVSLDNSKSVLLKMPAQDVFKIGSLPPGTEFTIVETDNVDPSKTDISAEDYGTFDKDTLVKTATGSTRTFYLAGNPPAHVVYHDVPVPLLPATGDQSALPALCAVLALCGGALFLLRRRRA